MMMIIITIIIIIIIIHKMHFNEQESTKLMTLLLHLLQEKGLPFCVVIRAT